MLFSSRHPEELKDLVAGLGELAQAGTVEQAIAFGDVVFVAVPYKALPQVAKDYGEALKGKIVCSISGGGTWSRAAVTVIASKGPHSGHPR